jgi:hypothetical protein
VDAAGLQGGRGHQAGQSLQLTAAAPPANSQFDRMDSGIDIKVQFFTRSNLADTDSINYDSIRAKSISATGNPRNANCGLLTQKHYS